MKDSELAQLSLIMYFPRERRQRLLSDLQWNIGQEFIVGGTQCYVLWNDDRAVVVFCGTNDFLDGLDDIRANQVDFFLGRVHEGFLNHVQRVWFKLGPAVEELASVGYKIHFTGHSLGGAAAQVAAVLCASRTGVGAIQPPVVFGSPNVFDYKQAKEYDRLFPEARCWINNNDIVPLVPFATLSGFTGFLHTLARKFIPLWRYVPAGYRRAGNLMYIDSLGVVHKNPPLYRRLIDRLKGRYYAGKHALTDGLRDHSCLHYYAGTEKWDDQ